MPFATFSLEVDAPAETLFEVLLEKTEDPKRWVGAVDTCELLERDGDAFLRRLVTPRETTVERIAIDREGLRIDSELVEHPKFRGSFAKKVTRPEGDGRPVLTYTLDWEPLEGPDDEDMTAIVMQGVQHTAKIAEERARTGSS